MKGKIFNYYASQIAQAFNISEGELFEKSKRREIVDARHMLYYACSQRPMRVVYIQNYMKERGYDIGHSSILHGIEMASNRTSVDKDYSRFVNYILDNDVINDI